jgi:hypothetical protein
MCAWRNNSGMLAHVHLENHTTYGKMCTEVLFTTSGRNIFLKPINTSRVTWKMRAETHVGLHVTCPPFCPTVTTTGTCFQISCKTLEQKFIRWFPSSSTCKRTDMRVPDGRICESFLRERVNNNNLTENGLVEYLLYYTHITFLYTVALN